MKPTPIRWGILGTGRIVRQFIKALAETADGVAIASGSRNQESAGIFKREFPMMRCHGSYEALLDDQDIDAVYVATPHPFHLEWAAAALCRKIPVLCEKPLAMNLAETQAMIDAARANDCALAEAFRYRFHPQTHKVYELVRSGVIGRIHQLHASFSVCAAFDPASRLFDPALGASAILDVGCYPMSMVRLMAGAAHGTAFENPILIQSMIESLRTSPEVDIKAIANLRFSDGLFAQIRCGIAAADRNSLEIDGTEGRLCVALPWSCSPANEPAQIQIHKNGEITPVEVTSPLSAMAHEASTFAKMVESGARETPCMSWDDSLGNIAAMHLWRANAQ
jgi:predicted dehydrogenase